MTENITPNDIEDLVLQFLPVFTSKPYNIEEVDLLYEEFRDYTRYALSRGYFSIADSNSALARITKLFYPLNYRDNRADDALKGIHLLYDNYNKENLNEVIINDIKSDELYHAVKVLTGVLDALKSELIQATFQSEIHKAILGMKIGYGNTSKNVEADLQNYLGISGMLGYYEPGTESEEAFITQCKVWTGVAEAGDFSNVPRVSAEDIIIAKKYERETNIFGGD